MHNIPFLQEMIARELAALDFNLEPHELYTPIDYTLSLSGKRMRPTLLLAGCDIFDGNLSKAVNPAIGMEIFHNFTLLHDDIMDQSPLRRGRPTVHNKWGINTAILSGDAMFIKAYQYISGVEDTCLRKVLQIFNKTALRVCEGQQLDMNYEKRNDISIDDYLYMTELKTAVLLAASLQIGGITAGAGDNDSALLYEFGKNIGIAFQLRDDMLDVFGPKEKTGKRPGGDILSNKKTFLLLKALELADTNVHEQLTGYINSIEFIPEEKIATVTGIYRELNIKDIVTEQIEFFYQQGLKYLWKVNAPETNLNVLRDFTDKLMVREF